MDLNNPIISKYVLWAGLIGIMILAVAPGNYAPETGFSDKLNHAAAFFVLCLLAMRVYPRMYLRCGLWLMLYGIVIEGIQLWVPGRSCSLMDLAADLFGIAAGIIMALIFNYKGQKCR